MIIFLTKTPGLPADFLNFVDKLFDSANGLASYSARDHKVIQR